MGIITISRQLGAGETTIVPAVAERLGWECLDDKILDREVQETGITMPYVIHHDEHAPGLMESWSHPLEAQKYFHALKRIMHDVGERGNAVVVGRGGNFLLKDTDALHVRLVADMWFRVERVMRVRWVSEAPAQEIIRQNDHDRASFHRHYFKADWQDPLHYDLLLNTARVGIESAIEILVTLAQLRWKDSLTRSTDPSQ